MVRGWSVFGSMYFFNSSTYIILSNYELYINYNSCIMSFEVKCNDYNRYYCYDLLQVGGLGDVVTSLSRAVQDLNQNVDIILPKYDCWKFNNVRFSLFHWPECSHMSFKMIEFRLSYISCLSSALIYVWQIWVSSERLNPFSCEMRKIEQLNDLLQKQGFGCQLFEEL